MEKHGKYGKAVVRATELVRDHESSPREEQFSEWQEAAIRNGCPSGAYLRLCEEGEINGVPKGDYMPSRLKENSKDFRSKELSVSRWTLSASHSDTPISFFGIKGFNLFSLVNNRQR